MSENNISIEEILEAVPDERTRIIIREIVAKYHESESHENPEQ